MTDEETRRKVGLEYDRVFDSGRWVEQIPHLHFPAGWSVKIVPPYLFAVIRFEAYSGQGKVSVYLDGYGMLGSVEEPYWEIYPGDENGEPSRFSMSETSAMLSAVQESLDRQNRAFGTERPAATPPATHLATTGSQKKQHRYDSLEPLDF